MDGALNSCGENYHCSQYTLISAVVWTAPGSWRPAQDRKGEWVGVTFYQTMSFDSMTIAGEPNSFSFVTSFRIQYQFTMHAPWYWIESPDGTPMVSSKVYKNDSFSHKLHYPFMSLIHVGKVFARHPAVRPFLWQKLSCNPYLRSCEKNVRHFSNIVQGKIFEILFDQILYQVLHIHAGFGDFDPFSKSQKEKRESLVFRMSQK